MMAIQLQMLSSPGCVHCKEFEEFWRTIANDWPNVTFEDISILTPQGQELAEKHMIFASPGIILNGVLFSTGGVHRTRFLEELKKISNA